VGRVGRVGLTKKKPRSSQRWQRKSFSACFAVSAVSS